MLLLKLALDRIDGGTVADSSGRQWIATCHRTRAIADPAGRFPACMEFDGESSAIEIAGLTCPPDFTFALWVRRAVLLTFYYAAILGFEADRPFFGFHQGRLVLGNGLTVPHELDTSWHHVAATQNARGNQIYIDGELAVASPSLAPTGGGSVRIGRDMGRGRAYFEGQLARLVIFDEALSQEAIRELMADPWLPLPASKAVSGDVVVVSGDLEAVSGDVVVVSGDLEAVSADLVVVSGDLEAVSGDVVVVSGDLEVVSVEQAAVSVELPAVSSVAEVVVDGEWWGAAAAPIVPEVHLPPRPLPLPYASHVPHLWKLHQAFPAFALRDFITVLGSGAPPSTRSPGLCGTFSHERGGALRANVGPFLLRTGGATIVELFGAEDDGAAVLHLDLAAPDLESCPRVVSRLKGKVALFGGSIVAEVDHEVDPEVGVRISLPGGLFGDDAEGSLTLHSWRSGEISLRARFTSAVRSRGIQTHLSFCALLTCSLDGPVFQQHIAFSFELVGEELCVSVPHHRPISSLEELILVFEDVGLPDIERCISAAIDRRAAAARARLSHGLLETLDFNLGHIPGGRHHG